MEGHIHLSTVSVLEMVAVVVLASFMLHQASLILGNSQSTAKQQWGAALAAGFGF